MQHHLQPEPKIPVNKGIHKRDVIIEEDAIYQDFV